MSKHTLEKSRSRKFKAFFTCKITNKGIDVSERFNPKYCPYCGKHIRGEL